MQFDGRSAKIMVVDNDRTTLEMVQIRLEVAGYHALPVRDAETALEMLTTSRPHAMILERNLPLMDGIGLLEAFAALPGSRPLPVLLVGRALAAEDVRRGVQLGVRDCLAKPFSGAVVLERLGRMLKKAAPPPPPGRSVVYV